MMGVWDVDIGLPTKLNRVVYTDECVYLDYALSQVCLCRGGKTNPQVIEEEEKIVMNALTSEQSTLLVCINV